MESTLQTTSTLTCDVSDGARMQATEGRQVQADETACRRSTSATITNVAVPGRNGWTAVYTFLRDFRMTRVTPFNFLTHSLPGAISLRTRALDL